MNDETFVAPEQPCGADEVDFINQNWQYLKKEPHFEPYDKPKHPEWRVRVPKTPPSSEPSSTWSQDGVDDQKPKPAAKPPPPLPPTRKIIKGRGKEHGCKPSSKILKKTESQIDHAQFGKPRPKPDFSHLTVVEQSKAMTAYREAHCIPKNKRYTCLPVKKEPVHKSKVLINRAWVANEYRARPAVGARPDQTARERLRVFQDMLLKDKLKQRNEV